MKKGCALITRASMGPGRAFACECAFQGKNLILVALPRSGLGDVAESIECDFSVKALALELDLTEQRGIELVGDAIHAAGAALDTVINNSGLGEPGAFLDLPAGYHDDVIALNATALVRLCCLAAETFAGREGCGILNIASLGSLFPNTFATTPESAALIARCGLASKLCCLSVERIAKAVLDGLTRGRPMIYPGRINASLAFLSRIAPPPSRRSRCAATGAASPKKSPTLWSPKEAPDTALLAGDHAARAAI